MSVNLVESLNELDHDYSLIKTNDLRYPLSALRGLNLLQPNRSVDREKIDVSNYPFLKLLKSNKIMNLEDIENGLESLIQKASTNVSNSVGLSRYDRNELKPTFLRGITPNIFGLAEYLEEFDHYVEPKVDCKSLKIRDPNGLAPVINAWLRCAVNQIYFEYCNNNKINPKGIISIPEHLVHHVFMSTSKEKLFKNVNYIFSKYVDMEESIFGIKVSKVYFSCYEKSLEASLKDIGNSLENFLNPSDLIPDYHKYKPAKFTYTFSKNSYKNIRGDLERQLAEMVSNWLTHPKCRIEIAALVDDEKCLDIVGGNKEKREYFNEIDGVVLHSDSKHQTIYHENIHSILNKVYSSASNTICDFIFEKTKGNQIQPIPFSDGNEFYKPLVERLPLADYATRIYAKFEKYSYDHEMITWLFSDLLLDKRRVDWRNIINQIKQENGNKSIRECMDEAVKVAFKDVQKKFKENFNFLCNESPELGAFVLTYLKGQM